MGSSKMELDISDLLSRVDSLLKDEKKNRNFAAPNRAFVYFNFLVPVGWTQTQELQHYYNVVPKSPLVDGWHYIIHGHDKWTPCAASHYCHLINYKPGPEHNPAFRKQFNKKWASHYEE